LASRHDKRLKGAARDDEEFTEGSNQRFNKPAPGRSNDLAVATTPLFRI